MKVGDKIRIQKYYKNCPVSLSDHVVEKFRHCLGIFLSDNDRISGRFTPLCNLYEPGPESEEKYLSNYGNYYTNLVQGWMDLPS